MQFSHQHLGVVSFNVRIGPRKPTQREEMHETWQEMWYTINKVRYAVQAQLAERKTTHSPENIIEVHGLPVDYVLWGPKRETGQDILLIEKACALYDIVCKKGNVLHNVLVNIERKIKQMRKTYENVRTRDFQINASASRNLH